MSSNEEIMGEEPNGDLFRSDSFKKVVKQRLKDRSKKVVQTKEMLSKQANQTREISSKQAVKIAKQAEEHQRFINKVTHMVNVLGFGAFCFLLGARFLLLCQYNVLGHAFVLPKNEKLFMVCFSFAEGPLAWALIVWCCSSVFSSVDIVSVLIHLFPGLVFFTIRWWDPAFVEAMHPEGTARRASWPYVESKVNLWTYLFVVPLVAYGLWQALYFLNCVCPTAAEAVKRPQSHDFIQGTLKESTEGK